MGGSIIQLVATGIPDLYLTGDPQITWFKLLYRRYTEFSMVDYPIKINGDPQPGDTHMINISPIADKLNRLSLIVDIPTPELKTKEGQGGRRKRAKVKDKPLVARFLSSLLLLSLAPFPPILHSPRA